MESVVLRTLYGMELLYLEIRYIIEQDDRLAISKVYEESWKYAYQGIVPQDYLDSIPEGQWASHIEQADRALFVERHWRERIEGSAVLLSR